MPRLCGLCGTDHPLYENCPPPVKTRGIVPEEPKIVALVPRKQMVEASDMAENLKILDGIRADLISGKIVSISGVCIAPDDGTYSFNCVVGRVSKLRTTGALATALHMFMRRAEK